MATTNGSTAIRDKILASLARYRALRIGKFPCAFWRLSARPGLTAIELKKGTSQNKIAEALEQSQSNISREIKRNTGQRGYRHKQAEDFAQERHKNRRAMLPHEIPGLLSP
ncbi:hypothetical protein [Bathymodiolus japonicus methanotrophic gill symbiont]|uniref:hypothetical protein n=1 Tax=Bathymodiolus japonicus methanotrophic gill symbiont TaxID=113269 RepID=UPI001C8EA6ED|nr:hypothetical protein [Bathymodiolus japonicus methanotrophic gill symbiont]